MVFATPSALPDDRSIAAEAIAALPPLFTEDFAVDTGWCLGLDIGTTALSATLRQAQTGQIYPLVWQEEASSEALASLPAIAYLSAQQLQHTPEAPIALGYQALESEFNATEPEAAGLLLSHMKPSLNAGIAYVNEHQTWEPVLQWSEPQTLALRWLQEALVALLETLQGKTVQGKTVGLTVTAPALTAATFQAAIAHLDSVVISCPAAWSDTYGFNLREAVLATGLVAHAEQIYFLEESIAALLATLPQPKGQLDRFVATRADTSLQGGTLVLSAGATTTELLLVDVPPDHTLLTREALYLHSLAYAGDAIDQDIICQILYPSAWNWDSLELKALTLPRPGEPDQSARDRLQQKLRSSELGRHLLHAARQLKLALQQQDSATFKLNNQQWTVSQQDLHSQVTMPYLQQLNRALNGLLNRSGMAVQAVQQVICTGGTTALPTIAHWLKQKLPNTQLRHDATSEHTTRSIAHGLAVLPHYPALLDAVRHQYSDYFLLHELVRILPDEPLSVGRILQQLEKQGINTYFCQRSILRLLEGQLPDGLLPGHDTNLFAPSSQQNPDYQILTAAPLFDKEGNQIYGFNPQQRDRLQHYMTALLANTHQTLAEPLAIELGVRVGGEG